MRIKVRFLQMKLICFSCRCSGLIRSSSQDRCFAQQNKEVWCITDLPLVEIWKKEQIRLSEEINSLLI